MYFCYCFVCAGVWLVLAVFWSLRRPHKCRLCVGAEGTTVVFIYVLGVFNVVRVLLFVVGCVV